MKNELLLRIWSSPTINTWLSFVVTPLNAIVFLPLLLKTFSVDQIALWFLFSLYISLQVLADFGFYNTFVRVISYGYGGKKEICTDNQDDLTVIGSGPNYEMIRRIIQTMNGVYSYATLVLFVILFLLSYTLKNQVNAIEGPKTEYWLAWGIIVFFSLINFNERRYSNILLGFNKVALVRRVQGIFALLTLFSNLWVLVSTKSFLLLVLTNQIWHLFRFFYFRNRIRASEKELFESSRKAIIHRDIFNAIWSPAWKGGLSSFASVGILKASGIIYSQFATSGRLAEYLLALKILDIIKNVSMAPFYSKIPFLSKLYGQNNHVLWRQTAQRGIGLSNMLFVLGIITAGILGDFLLELISSNVLFPDKHLWYLLGFALFFHRYGAMHTQLYMTSNRVNSHISDIVAGLLFLTSSLILFKVFDVYAFAYGMLIAYLGFYVWYALYYSYKLIKQNYFYFELKTSVFPMFVLIISTLINFAF